MLYALGALDMFGFMYAIHTVRMTIYQPRLDNISEWEIPAEELLIWGANELAPQAKMAFAGEGSFVPGSIASSAGQKPNAGHLLKRIWKRLSMNLTMPLSYPTPKYPKSWNKWIL